MFTESAFPDSLKAEWSVEKKEQEQRRSQNYKI